MIIWARKQSCPRNKGYFYCEECYNKALEEAIDYPCDIKEHFGRGCGKEFNGKYCGYSHLGYSWCKECLEKGIKECNHYGFEVVSVIREPIECEEKCL